MTIPMPRTAIEGGDRVALIAEPAVLDDVRGTLQG